jgi:uncharacterized protein YdeI (YjbR/CyaY-like superfamily)
VDEKQGLPVLAFDSAEAWAQWIEEHDGDPGLWLKLARKDAGIPSVTYAEALDVALCHGWIDGQKAAADGPYWLQKFVPRGPRSKWSKINREKATTLMAEGRMTERGIAAVESAKRDGRWEQAYEPQSTAAVPEDLQRALDANPDAAAFFDRVSSSNRYAVLYRIADAKKPETRARRIEQYVAMLARGETLHPQAEPR